MTCMEAQALITPFINDKLDISTLEQFIDHVENCSECKEELEVYYALLTAMKQLDEDEEVSADFAKELENKLKESQEKILRAKLIHIRKRILFFIVVIFIGLFTSVSVTVVEEALTVSDETKMNTAVIQNEVLTPYMNNAILNHIITYKQLQDEIQQAKEEQLRKEAQAEERAREILERKRQKQKEKAALNAEEALEENYSQYGPYSRLYAQASDAMRLQYQKVKEEQDEQEQEIQVDSPMEYSR